jgi:hypothetical protein
MSRNRRRAGKKSQVLLHIMAPVEEYCAELGEWVKIPTTYAGGAKGSSLGCSILGDSC